MERLNVNLIQDRIDIEKKEGKLFMGGVSKLDQKLHPSFADERWIKLNKRQYAEMDTYLDANDQGFNLSGAIEMIIPYSTIEYVSLSMCSRMQGMGFNRYQIDLDITTSDCIYQFEIFNPKHFYTVIMKLRSNNIEIVDMVGVIGLYEKFPDYDKLYNYIRTNFNQIAKKYHLDHPRTEGVAERYLENINTLKDIFGGNRK